MFLVSKMYEKPPTGVYIKINFPGLYPGPLINGNGRETDEEGRDKKGRDGA